MSAVMIRVTLPPHYSSSDTATKYPLLLRL